MDDKLSKDFHYYLANQDELLKKYEGRYLVIVNCEVMDDFIDMDTAIKESSKKYGWGNFLLQYCSKGDSAYTQRFYNSYVKF